MRKIIFGGIFVAILPIIVISAALICFKKNIFDNPDFWYAYMTYFGTACLAVVSLWQNENANKTNQRLSEENLYYQKVTSQKLYPIIGIRNLISSKCEEISHIHDELPQIQTFNRHARSKNSMFWEQVVSINLDCENKENDFYKKTLSFNICNLSDAFIRHILIDDILICGFKDKFENMHCSNKIKGNGFSDILNSNNSLPLTINIYFKDEIYKEIFDNPLAGLSIILFFTNTTITGIQQKQYAAIDVTENNQKISYGDKTYDEWSREIVN